jgi:hypothetical protein
MNRFSIRRLDLDRAYRNLAGPRIGETAHSPGICNSRGGVGVCRYCGAHIYFWTCDHMHGQKLPFESWLNGRLESGAWDFHNEGYCKYTFSELRAIRGGRARGWSSDETN